MAGGRRECFRYKQARYFVCQWEAYAMGDKIADGAHIQL